MNRIAERSRATRETEISVSVKLDGSGEADVTTSIGFFDQWFDFRAKFRQS